MPRLYKHPSTTTPATLLYCALCLAPVLALLSGWTYVSLSNWQHLLDHLLPQAAVRTIGLCVFVAATTAVLGTLTAWLVGCFEFPGRRILRVILTLPLALPNYVIGFAWLSLTDYGGPLGSLDNVLGTSMSLWLHQNNWLSAGTSLSFALFPYIYLMTLASIEGQGRLAVEAALIDGASAPRILQHVILPIALPAATAGMLLVVMETLADFGTVAIFNYDTFSVVIYKVWFSLFDLNTAVQLALLMVVLLLPLIVFRLKWLRASAVHLSMDYVEMRRITLRPKLSAFISGLLWTTVGFTFFLPIVTLAVISLPAWTSAHHLWQSAFNTLLFSALAACGVLLSAGIQTWLRARPETSAKRTLLLEYANIGYALPGTLLAVGVLQAVTTFGPLLSGTIVPVVFGLTCRFQMIGAQSLWSGMLRVPKSLRETARLDGAGPVAKARSVYAPFLKSHVAAGAVLVLLEAAKEMPITLMTRPFGSDTLAVKIFQFTSEGEYGRAAVPALVLALCAATPQLLFLAHKMQWGRRKNDAPTTL